MPQPQIEIRLPKGTHHRTLNAALHRLAADVELATPAAERWCVQHEAFCDDRGIVYHELADATPAEAQCGTAVLRGITARLRMTNV